MPRCNVFKLRIIHHKLKMEVGMCTFTKQIDVSDNDRNTIGPLMSKTTGWRHEV